MSLEDKTRKALDRFVAKTNRLVGRIMGGKNVPTQEQLELVYNLLGSQVEHKKKLANIRASHFGDITRGVKAGYPLGGLIPVGRGIASPRQVGSEKLEHQIRLLSSTIPGQSFLPAVRTNPIQDVYNKVIAKLAQDTGRQNWAWKSNWMYREAQSAPTEFDFFPPVTMEQAQKFKKDRENEETIKRFHSSESIKRHRGMYNYMLDTMDDYDRKIHDLGKKYGGGSEGRRRADDVIRNNALKGLPKFMQKLLKNSSISTKTLGAMTHMMPRVFGILSNPIAMGAALGIGTWKLASGFSENADNANRSVVSWRNAANFFGTPSERFQKAAYLAGIKDPAKIAQMFGELTYNFGDAETAMESIGYSLKGKGAKERLFTAKSLGITPEILAMMDLYSGQIVPDEVRQMTAKRSMVGVTSKMMGTSDQAWWNKVASYAGNESIATRLSDVDFSDVRGGNKVSIILNGPVNVNADDAEAFADSVQKESSKNSGISALEEQDTREK